MPQDNFGLILRDARERKGYDVSEAARILRIRVDILRAIEESDFSRMPPRGYTRNMINAYARLVGLNPTEMTRMYLNAAQRFQSEPSRARLNQETGRNRPASSRPQGESLKPRDRVAQQSRGQLPASSNSLGRAMYDDRREYVRDYGSRSGVSDQLYSSSPQRSSRGSARGSQYTNFYAGPSAASTLQSKAPFLIAGVIILILLILVLFLAFGNKGSSSSDDVTNVPITGVNDTTQTSESDEEATEEEVVPVPVAPTSVTVEYSVDDTEIYASISVDGTASDQMITGPVTEEVEVSGTWTFGTWVTDSVTITVGGVEVDFDGTDDTGMPTCTVEFDSYLADWYEDNPEAVVNDDSEDEE